MHVHLVGVAGTGMGALAALFEEAGHEVSGSDVAFDPPMGPALERWACAASRASTPRTSSRAGPRRRRQRHPAGRTPRPRAAERRGSRATSMSRALASTSSRSGGRSSSPARTARRRRARCARGSCRAPGASPGASSAGSRRGSASGAAIGTTRGRVPGDGRAAVRRRGRRVRRGLLEKQPKFSTTSACPDDVAIVTSIEHDHIDIYPDEASYDAAFRGFVRAVPAAGLIVCDAHDARRRARSSASDAKARVAWYALEGDDTGEVTPTWLGAPARRRRRDGAQSLRSLRRRRRRAAASRSACPGAHNVRNALAAIAACAEGFGARLDDARARARRASRACGAGRICSASPAACASTTTSRTTRPPSTRRCARCARATRGRALGRLRAAQRDRVPRAPPGGLRARVRRRRPRAPRAARPHQRPRGRAPRSRARSRATSGRRRRPRAGVDAIVARVVEGAKPGDTVALLSNGAFGGIHERLLAALGRRREHRRRTPRAPGSSLVARRAREAAGPGRDGLAPAPAGGAQGPRRPRHALRSRERGAPAASCPARAPFPVVGEERAASARRRPDEPTWYVDPLDGTTNFVHGHPVLVRLGRPDRGRAGRCRRRRRARARRASGPASPARGATRNGEPCRVSDVAIARRRAPRDGLPVRPPHEPGQQLRRVRRHQAEGPGRAALRLRRDRPLPRRRRHLRRLLGAQAQRRGTSRRAAPSSSPPAAA